MNDLEAKKALLSCPGDTIQDTIDEIGMSQAELAERLGRSIPKLNELIKGKAPITKETAVKLEYVLGVAANFWLNLERRFQDELLEIEQLAFLEDCKVWLKSFPVPLMKRFNLLPDTKEKTALVEGLLKYFRVASPKQWSEIYAGKSLAFKIELRHTAEPEAISVWLRLGELQAEMTSVSTFDKKTLRQRLPELQQLSFEKPIDWMDRLQQICAECGVSLVYTPKIAKAPIYGATRWIKNNSVPLVQLTDRREDYNAFWFTFFHELGHVLYHGKKDIFINGLDSIEPDQEKENQADEFASKMLLSEKERNELFNYSGFTKENILVFSTKYKKHPSIVVAQLQREGLVSYKDFRLSKLKEKVVFEDFSM
ncbi:MAG: HigA family addiction module antitoxin [Maribacter arcticus]|uniref:HigA family addiction module antitoxin n=1 Tax=Maribacter arcticus TaxID=561365 RepID=UPI00300150CE